jgi:GH15 family glucan-1,4-alpha-glucosidase
LRLEDLGLIGNCQFSALVHRDGTVVWCCLPRFDAEPVFGALLDRAEGGGFQVAPASGTSGLQRYLPNTNVLETLFDDESGAFRLLDFAPRFDQHERSFRPTQLFRILEPLRGQPRVRVTCDPRLGWSQRRPQVLAGSNHLQFEGFPAPVRLTTDVPLTHVASGQPFALTGRRHLVLTWGHPIEEPLQPLADRFLDETVRYWRRWVKGCSVPVQFQEQVIRSALALKLHCFEDTGAIVAATTTSIPEAPGSGRTWDYRYCWLRDAYHVLGAFHVLGRFEERERFIQWLFDVAGGSHDLDLAPSTGSTAVPTWWRPSCRAGPASAARARCASATPPRCNARMTSSARRPWRWRRCFSTSASRTSSRPEPWTCSSAWPTRP